MLFASVISILLLYLPMLACMAMKAVFCKLAAVDIVPAEDDVQFLSFVDMHALLLYTRYSASLVCRLSGC